MLDLIKVVQRRQSWTDDELEKFPENPNGQSMSDIGDVMSEDFVHPYRHPLEENQ